MPLASPPNGPRRADPARGLWAVTGATVIVKPGVKLEGATILIQGGVIVDVIEAKARAGEDDAPGDASPPATTSAAALPPGAREFDARGLYVYPGFIEPYVEVDVPRPDADAPGTHWNPRVTPERWALEKGAGGIDKETAESLRSMGFVAAAIVPRGGIVRGTGAVVSLLKSSGDVSEARARVYAERAFQGVGLNGGPGVEGAVETSRWVNYPNSQMGAIALLRQTFLDADWQRKGRDEGWFKEPTGALDSVPGLGETLLWDTGDELETLRALAISRELGRAAIVLGSGREYRRLEALKTLKPKMIVPLNFPERPRVTTPGEADAVELRDLIAWEQGPTNPRRLDAAGISVALTSARIPESQGGRGAFPARLASAIKHGLSGDRALAMLTTTPAGLLGVSEHLGSIEKGKAASFVVADGPLLTDKPDAPVAGVVGSEARRGRVLDVWIDGVRHAVHTRTPPELIGEWAVEFDEQGLTPDAERDFGPVGRVRLKIDQHAGLEVHKDFAGDARGRRVKAAARAFVADPDGRFSFVFDHDAFGQDGVYSVSGAIEREKGVPVLHGTVRSAAGRSIVWSATRLARGGEAHAGPLAHVPTPEAVSGVWTLVLKDGAAKPDSDQHPRVELSGDRAVRVKRGEAELDVTDVTFETTQAGGERVVGAIRYSVHGLTGDDSITRVTLKPTPDRDRLQGSTKADGSDVFELARHVPTPEHDEIASIPERLGLPVGPYSVKEYPEQGSVLITNTTVWTSGPQGIIENGFVAIQAGKVSLISPTLPSLQGEWTIIDGKGKHVTPGIIDCHSHTGISGGVNESGQAITAEVRIGDVTDPDSISWYRQLAGGVTCVNSLHGSANAMGGQSRVVKVRWGVSAPGDMHFDAGPGGIKFALGENVKQSNWGDRAVTRYPQTRMGVEAIMRDRFIAARAYAGEWGVYLRGVEGLERSVVPESFAKAVAKVAGVPEGVTLSAAHRPRRDLELEALVEVLGGTRLVHCHSYRQDEILMFCRVAREFGFTIGTFQHALEGYKVAEAIRERAIGASAFSDWWNYKVEVQDAIPQGGPIMHEQGVCVSFNSDSDEMARRLNVEAGKAMKCAGNKPTDRGVDNAGDAAITPAEALKFVTLNPAKQLGIESRVGSLEVGKDADVVLWSGPPMSTAARVEKTWVDGRLMYSMERDKEHRETIAQERRRIIQKILVQQQREESKAASIGGGPRAAAPRSHEPSGPPKHDERASGRGLLLAGALQAAVDARREMLVHMLKRGQDPRWYISGDCGCGELDAGGAE